MLFEVLGLGCGSGPLTGRYLPPVGGFLSFILTFIASILLMN